MDADGLWCIFAGIATMVLAKLLYLHRDSTIMRNRFVVITIALLALASCVKEEKPVIPFTSVNFTIMLSDPAYIILQSPATAIKVKYYNALPLGYKGNGVIVANGIDGFVAWDATCPKDLSGSVAIEGITGTCPSCGTKYSLLTGYAQDKSGSHLQSISVTAFGNQLSIIRTR